MGRVNKANFDEILDQVKPVDTTQEIEEKKQAPKQEEILWDTTTEDAKQSPEPTPTLDIAPLLVAVARTEGVDAETVTRDYSAYDLGRFLPAIYETVGTDILIEAVKEHRPELYHVFEPVDKQGIRGDQLREIYKAVLDSYHIPYRVLKIRQVGEQDGWEMSVTILEAGFHEDRGFPEEFEKGLIDSYKQEHKIDWIRHASHNGQHNNDTYFYRLHGGSGLPPGVMDSKRLVSTNSHIVDYTLEEVVEAQEYR